MKVFKHFITDGIKLAASGGKIYHIWMGALTFFMLLGAYLYSIQLREGLIVTGMNDHVSWGLYISNFTFLVGLAAAAVMIVLPAYIFDDIDFSRVTLIGEGVAVGALCMCLAFVTVDVGGPQNLWHMMPVVGYFNWPDSILAWDVIVLNVYLALNACIPLYILIHHYQGKVPNKKIYMPFVILSVFWAVGIHLVTAFLFAGLPARPFWNSSLLGPRFLASAFAAGPSFILVVMLIVRKYTDYRIERRTIRKLAMMITIAAQINLIMLGSELFKEFYHPTEHSHSAQYLFFGLHGHNSLVPWIWCSVLLNLFATIGLSIHKIREDHKYLNILCVILFISIWVEKGMGLIVPGFIPSPLGEIVEYTPSWVEIGVTLGIWAMGLFILTVLVRVALAVELGIMRYPASQSQPKSD